MLASPVYPKDSTAIPEYSVPHVSATLLVNTESLEISECDAPLLRALNYTENNYEKEGLSLHNLFGSAQLERLMVQFEQTKASNSTRYKFSVYQLKAMTGEKKVYYVYTSAVIENYLKLTLIPEYSTYDIPFISFDTRDLFLKQFGHINFGTFEWIIKGNKLFCSEGVYRMYEMDFQENITHDFIKQFTHADEREKMDRFLAGALSEGVAFDTELKIVTAKGNLKYLSMLVSAIKSEDGTVSKLAGSLRDITEQRIVEHDLEKSIQELHRSNAELEEFAYVASHDLQEPLRKISTFSDRLAEKCSDSLAEDDKVYLERIMASTENMRMLISHLLDFSRVVKTSEPFVPVNLNFVLHQVKSDLEVLLEETQTNLLIEDLPTIQSSVSQMKQLFSNLVNNAVKFRKPGAAPVVSIKCQVLSEVEKADLELKNDKYFRISVVDNGIGFDNEYAERIFQIFQRLHGKADYPGSGIGLAICKKIIERHQGLISAESTAGNGATFSLIIPEKQTKEQTH